MCTVYEKKIICTPIRNKKAPGGVEPSTSCLLDRRSNQLSYGASCMHGKLKQYINVKHIQRRH